MQVTTVGLDLAKNIFRVHGITAEGSVAFNRALRRSQVLTFLRGSPLALLVSRLAGPAITGPGH